MQRTDVVAAIIIRDGRILLTQRKRGKAFEYKWSTPGGKVEPGEHDHIALRRECLEEVNASLGDVSPLPTLTVALDSPRVACPLRVYYYLAPLSSDSHEPRPMEGQGFGWFTADDLERLELTPADEARRAELVMLVRGAQ